MLSRPDISDDAIASVLNAFGLRISEASFIPSGDTNSAVYRVITDDRARYVLKSRRGDFDEIAASVPAYLYSKGIRRVMAPIRTIANQLWIHAHGFDWMLYPFFDGKNAFERPLSKEQWIALGETMRQVHTTILPPELARRVPRESYSPRNREIVKALGSGLERRSFHDPAATELAAFWMSRRGEIRAMVERAEQLAPKMPRQAASFVLCHSDLHAGNVLVGRAENQLAENQITIVDWDNPILAPRERDLMFIGGGIGGSWNDLRESEWFFAGYGPAEIDSLAIAYYRYERIVVDIAEYAQRIFEGVGSTTDRLIDLRKLLGGFAANNVIDTAHRFYLTLT